MAAQAYAFRPDSQHTPRLRWRKALGLTHAGTWIGLAGDGQLAVYLPNQYDDQGTVALLDLSQGMLRLSYAVALPPIAADANLRRLYLAGAGWVRAIALDSGAPVATVSGAAPLAVGDANGLVAFLSADQIVVARGDRLDTVLALPYPRSLPPTALAWQGPTLLVGNARGITRVALDECA
jgi:hypothetical protein